MSEQALIEKVQDAEHVQANKRGSSRRSGSAAGWTTCSALWTRSKPLSPV